MPIYRVAVEEKGSKEHLGYAWFELRQELDEFVQEMGKGQTVSSILEIPNWRKNMIFANS